MSRNPAISKVHLFDTRPVMDCFRQGYRKRFMILLRSATARTLGFVFNLLS